MTKVLVTGGLGFIGSHLVDELISRGYQVRVLDSLLPQVFAGSLPEYVNPKAEVIVGDVRDPGVWAQALSGVELVFHEAARVGLGQAQYQIHDFLSVNVGGTAQLLDYLANNEHSVRKFLFAGSNTVYGEGLYECPEHGFVEPRVRVKAQMDANDWTLKCPECGVSCKPVSTPESKSQMSTNVYSLSKKFAEDLCFAFGETYGLPVVSTRCFNVYGPRQSLSNPYTGVAAIFLSRLLNGERPVVFEDGLQSRDFVHVRDVVRAKIHLMESDLIGVFNVGTGRGVSILDLAKRLADGLGVDIVPKIANRGRAGDVRHCLADNSRLVSSGFEFEFPELDISTLLGWADGQSPVDGFSKANKELEDRGLL